MRSEKFFDAAERGHKRSAGENIFEGRSRNPLLAQAACDVFPWAYLFAAQEKVSKNGRLERILRTFPGYLTKTS